MMASTSMKKFEKNRLRFIEDNDEATFLTVHGITISSEFSVDLAIIVGDTLGETKHE